jgi:putative ABC transport system permease protein
MHLLRDVRFGLRQLGKSPGLTAAGVLAVALGIGLVAAMFSIVNGVLFQSLPFDRADQLVAIDARNPSKDEKRVALYFRDFLDLRERQSTFQGLTAYDAASVNLSDDAARPERLNGAHLSVNAFDVLRTRPLLGRTFRAGDDAPGAAPVAILSYDLWQSRYGGDPAVLGRILRVNGEPSTVIGVMPEGFAFPINQVLWAPLRLDPARAGRTETDKTVGIYGRLRDGVSIDRAQAELSTLGQGIAAEAPIPQAGLEIRVQPYTREVLNGSIVLLFYSMLAAVCLVLLLSCANVASLMMARASQRSREIAIRSALGAARRQVVVQILVESLLLAAVGAAGGLLLSRWGVHLFNTALVNNLGDDPPFWFRIALDPRAVAVTLALTVVAGLLSGLLPALQASRAEAADVLKDEGRGTTSLRMGRFTRGVVILEVALSCALLVCAGLMVQSIFRLEGLKLGFNEKQLLTFEIALYQADYPQEADRKAFWSELLPRLAALPGVEGAAAVTTLPTSGSERMVYTVEGQAFPRPEELPRANVARVSPGFFATIGARLTTGRDFGTQDGPDALPVVVVNRSFAERAWPGLDPLGRRIRVGQAVLSQGGTVWRTVVGVVPDLQMAGIAGDGEPHGFYLPLAQSCPQSVSVVLRAHGAPEALTATARAQVAAIDRDLPIYSVQTMEKVIAANAFFHNLFGSLFAVFGACALALAAVGIYGVVAFSVAQRTQEIGVRMALGAGKGQVLRMILRQGAWQLAIGLGVGLVLAMGLAVLFTELLFQVTATDLPTYAGVIVVLATVTLLACLVPARRATRVDPLVAIRH